MELPGGDRQCVGVARGRGERELARAAFGEGAASVQHRRVGNHRVRPVPRGDFVKTRNGRRSKHVSSGHPVEVQYAPGHHVPLALPGNKRRTAKYGFIPLNRHIGLGRGQGSAVDLSTARINGGIIERSTADGKVGFPYRQCGTGVVAFHISTQGYLRSIECTACNRNIGGTNISGEGSGSGSINVGAAPDLACVRAGFESQVG